jgi:small nuclear ribonucleoprotein (snRNP)-like protein
MPQAQPELKKVSTPLSLPAEEQKPGSSQRTIQKLTIVANPQYLDKRIEVQLNGSRKVMGTLRGYDVSYTLLLTQNSKRITRALDS